MTSNVLNQVPMRWHPYFVDVVGAVRPLVSRPVQLRSALARWTETEPALATVQVTQLFERPGSLTDPQLRALIRIGRTEDRSAETATWAVICQLLPAVAACVGIEAVSGSGSEGYRAAVNTSIAELWRHIHCINLDTNKASIFFALSRRIRHDAQAANQAKTIVRFTKSLVDPNRFSTDTGHDDGPALVAVSNRPRTSWLTPDPAWGTRAFDNAEWAADAAAFAEWFIDTVTNDMVLSCNWNPEGRTFDERRQRLADYLWARLVTAATDQQAPTAKQVAASLGASVHTIRELQGNLNRVLNLHTDRYRPQVRAALGFEDDPTAPMAQAA